MVETGAEKVVRLNAKVELLNAIPAHLGYSRERRFVDKITRGGAFLRTINLV